MKSKRGKFKGVYIIENNTLETNYRKLPSEVRLDDEHERARCPLNFLLLHTAKMLVSSLLRARTIRCPVAQSVRHFKDLAEHAQWVSRVKASAEPRPSCVVAACAQEAAPFLFSVDPMVSHLNVYAAPNQSASIDSLEPRPPSASMLDVRYPLETDLALRYVVADKSDDRAFFRLSKFLEAVDALTADVAYRHTDGTARGLALVTAGHAHSRKLQVTQLNRDVWLRCYVTSCGKNSLEVRTDAIQVML